MELGKLAARHIYFRLLYVRWFERMNRMGLDQDWGSEEDWNMLSELRQLRSSSHGTRSRSNVSLTWCWMWTRRGEIPRSRPSCSTGWRTHPPGHVCLPPNPAEL